MPRESSGFSLSGVQESEAVTAAVSRASHLPLPNRVGNKIMSSNFADGDDDYVDCPYDDFADHAPLPND